MRWCWLAYLCCSRRRVLHTCPLPLQVQSQHKGAARHLVFPTHYCSCHSFNHSVVFRAEAAAVSAPPCCSNQAHCSVFPSPVHACHSLLLLIAALPATRPTTQCCAGIGCRGHACRFLLCCLNTSGTQPTSHDVTAYMPLVFICMVASW